MSSDEAVQLIERTDATLKGLEDNEVERLNAALESSYVNLEKDLLRKYPNYTADAQPGLLATQRGLLLANDLKQSLILINPEREAEIEARFNRLLQTSSKEGTTLGEELIWLQQGDDFVKATAMLPIEAVGFAASDAVKRLKKHDAKFQEEASTIIQQGLIQGWGAMRTAGQLRQRLGVAKGRAETIARTEIISAQDSATRATYKSNGVDWIVRIGTQDKRICPYCAARAGQVYPVDTPITAHPNDRCYSAPWFPDLEQKDPRETEWIKRHARETQKQFEGDLNYGPTPFEVAAGINAAKPVWTPKDGYLDKNVERQGQSWAIGALALALILRGRNPDNPEQPAPPDQPGQQENELLKALMIGAAIVGVSVGSYYLARTRYRAGFKQSARMADAMARDLLIVDPGENDQFTFVAGGFAGQKGEAGLEYAPIFGRFLPGHQMVGVPTPEFDLGDPILDNPLSNITTNWSNVVGTAVVKGRNMSAVRMAAMAAAHYRKYGKPVNLIGYSGGGMIASEAHEILKEMGIPVKTATIGTPWFGFTDLPSDQHLGLIGKGDMFVRLPIQNRLELESVDSHWLNAYTNNPDAQAALQEWFSISEHKQRERQPQQVKVEVVNDLDETLIDLYPETALLSDAEIKQLPGRLQQKLLAAKKQAAIVVAPPSAIQLADARRQLAEIQRGIELGPIDLGEAVIERLTIFGEDELDVLPSQIRNRIAGYKQNLLAGRLDPRQLPATAQAAEQLRLEATFRELIRKEGLEDQLKGLLRGELPDLKQIELVLQELPVEAVPIPTRTAKELYKQARSVERGQSRLAGFRIREQLARIAKQDLPPGQKLKAYRQTIYDELKPIVLQVGAQQSPGTAKTEEMQRFDFGGIQWFTPELKPTSPAIDLLRKVAELDLPDDMVKAIDTIYLSKQKNAAELFWRKKLKVLKGKVPATINLSEGSIIVHGRATVQDVMRQAGYLLAYQKFGQLEPPEGSEYRRAMAEGRTISPYGFNGDAADFADSVAQFFVDPDRLKRFNPRRYNALTRLLNYRHPETLRVFVPDEPDPRGPEIIDRLRTRNREINQGLQQQRETANTTAQKQRSTKKVQQAVEKTKDAEIQASLEDGLSRSRLQEESLDRLTQAVDDLEQRSAQILNPFNSPYFTEVPPRIRQAQRQLKAVERELAAIDRVTAISAKVRANATELQSILSDLTTRKESLKATNQGQKLEADWGELVGDLEIAEQELIGLPRSNERAQALRDLVRLRAAIRAQESNVGVNVASLHNSALQPRIQVLQQLADSLDELQARSATHKNRLSDLQTRLSRLPQKLTDLGDDQRARYNAVRSTKVAQSKLPQRVENYRTLKEAYTGQLAQLSQNAQKLTDDHASQRTAAINSVQAAVEDRLKQVNDSLTVLAALRPGSVAWLVDSRNWERGEVPADLAIILASQPGKTKAERLKMASDEIVRLIGRVKGNASVLEQRLDYVESITAKTLEQAQAEQSRWEQIRDDLADEDTITDRQIQAFLKGEKPVKAIDVIRYGNQLVGDLEAFNQDFVRLLLDQEGVDPRTIIDQAELYRRAREAFLNETEQTRGRISAEIEQSLTTLSALQQKLAKEQEQPIIYEVNGKARTAADIRAELAQIQQSVDQLLSIRQVSIEAEQQGYLEEGRAQQRAAEQAAYEQRQAKLQTLKDELGGVNREIQKRREAAERGQKRGTATDRLEAQQRRILRDIAKLGETDDNSTN